MHKDNTFSELQNGLKPFYSLKTQNCAIFEWFMMTKSGLSNENECIHLWIKM